jgi:hypothetical protein
MPGVLSTLSAGPAQRPAPSIRPAMLHAGCESIEVGDCSRGFLSLQGELPRGKCNPDASSDLY